MPGKQGVFYPAEGPQVNPGVAVSAWHVASQAAGDGPGHNHGESHVEKQDKHSLALGPGKISPRVLPVVRGWFLRHSLAIVLKQISLGDAPMPNL